MICEERGGRPEQLGGTGPTPSNWRVRRAARMGRAAGSVLLGDMLLATCTIVCKLEYDARMKSAVRIAAALIVAWPLRTEIAHTSKNTRNAMARRTPSTVNTVEPKYAEAERDEGQATQVPPVLTSK